MAQFTKLHASIIGAFATAKAKADKLIAESTTKQNAEIQKLVDAHVIACNVTKAEYLKGNSKTNEARGEVKALFDTLVSKEYISKNSAQQYAQCFWIAFEKGIPFARDLVNVKAKAKADATAKAESVKAGAVTTTYPATITVAAAAAKAGPVATAATAFIQAGSAPTFSGVIADSATAGSVVIGTTIGQIQVKNQSAAGVAASDTITATLTGSGYLNNGTSIGRAITVTSVESSTISIVSDGTSGLATITITTGAGASFVKTANFFDTKPSKATATVAKAFIKAGTGSVADVFTVVVTDVLGNAVTNAVITAAPTDTTTTVGGAATCGTYNAAKAVYYCSVVGKAEDLKKIGGASATTGQGGGSLPGSVTTTGGPSIASQIGFGKGEDKKDKQDKDKAKKLPDFLKKKFMKKSDGAPKAPTAAAGSPSNSPQSPKVAAGGLPPVKEEK